MDRVNGTDWVDIGGGRRGFRSQNAAAGIPGTEVTDKILNDVQEEICAVIENSGFVLDPENQQQLWDALQSVAAPGFANRAAWLPVISVTTTAPPSDAVLGDTYIIPAGATGVWAGNQQKLAEWTGSAWRIVNTKGGHGVSLPDGRIFEKVGGVYIEKLALDSQSGKWRYAIAGGTATAITLTLTPVPQAYADGLVIRFKVAFTCQGASTINVNGLGAVALVRQGNGALERFDWFAGDVIEAVYVNGAFQLLNPAQMQFLTSAQGTATIFVRTDGNDNNDGSANTAAKAFATIDAAALYALRRFNTVTQTTVIQLGNAGSYDGCTIGGIANLRLRGDPANPSVYIVGGTRLNAIRLDYCPGFRIEGIKIRNGITTSTSSNGLLVGSGSNGYLVHCELDPVVYHLGYAHIAIADGAQLSWAGTIKFLRSAPIAIDVSMGGVFSGGAFADPATVQMGAGFNQETFIRVIGGRASILATTFVGANGGKRYDVSMNGAINTAGAGANFLPGDVAGVTATGGVYV